MKVDRDKCIGCLQCVPYCPMRAISKVKDERRVDIDQDRCVECGTCERVKVCEPAALFQPPLPWPRAVRGDFSNPIVEHKQTGIPGRGTEEMKTNDVTARFRPGRVGIAVELGRPGIGARFYDVEKIAMAAAQFGVEFEPKNPVTFLLVDKEKGKIDPEVLNERVLSAIVEFDVAVEQAPVVLAGLREASRTLDTVCSVNLCSVLGPDEENPLPGVELPPGVFLSFNGKTNVGLGRPRNPLWQETHR